MAFLGAALSDTSSWTPAAVIGLLSLQQLSFTPNPGDNSPSKPQQQQCLFNLPPASLSAGDSSTFPLGSKPPPYTAGLPLLLQVFLLSTRAHSAPLPLLLSVCYNFWQQAANTTTTSPFSSLFVALFHHCRFIPLKHGKLLGRTLMHKRAQNKDETNSWRRGGQTQPGITPQLQPPSSALPIATALEDPAGSSILFPTPLLVFLKMHTSPASSAAPAEQPHQARSWKELRSAPSFTRQPHPSTEMMPDS